LLFTALYHGSASTAIGILFGEIFGISTTALTLTSIAGILTVAALVVIYRPLLFATLDEEVAEARGVPVRALSIAFMLILAIAVSEAVQVVGVLLVLTLLITPAAAAQKLTAHPGVATLLSLAIALTCTMGGVVASLLTPYPASFYVATLSFLAYVASRVLGPRLLSR
jgi:zinc/manganese transport system permease protein